jgi:hypothetical protein
MQNFLGKLKSYMPSKTFLKVMGSALFIILIFVLIFYLVSKKELFKNKPINGEVAIQEKTIAELVQSDTDLDSIPDWEEALWGTDKNNVSTFDDIPDSQYIENKKKELKIEQELNDKELNETEQFAREFFTSYIALKSSGEVDQTSINNFASALGEKIADANLIDTYTEADLSINLTDSKAEREKYYNVVKKIFETYKKKGLGEELDVINNGLLSYSSTGKNTDYSNLIVIANAYKDFAKETLKVKVPKSLVDEHLNLVNSANNLGISVANMINVINDPIVGLSGISQYQKYSDDLVEAVLSIEKTF